MFTAGEENRQAEAGRGNGIKKVCPFALHFYVSIVRLMCLSYNKARTEVVKSNSLLYCENRSWPKYKLCMDIVPICYICIAIRYNPHYAIYVSASV